MTIKTREVELKNNLVGIQLDIHKNGSRRKKMLNIRLIKNPKTPLEREINRERKETIKRIIATMEINEVYSDNLLDKGYDTEKDFFEYCEEFIDRKAPFCETRAYQSMLLKLKDFSKKKRLPCSEITEDFLVSFKDYLNANLNGSTPFNYFKKLKRVLKEATIAKHFKSNPAIYFKNSKGVSTEKEVLTLDEMTTLTTTVCSNNSVGRAFLFCCLTGLRFCDVKNLKWNNISEDNVMSIVQLKTKEKLVMPLHSNAVKLFDERKYDKSFVFDLPTHTGCLNILKKWMEDANIHKKITWHCARHTFATSLVFNKVDVTTVSALLGHRDLRQTMVYVRVAELSKTKAIDKLPEIFKK